MQTISRQPLTSNVEGVLRDYKQNSSVEICKAYLQGALHDGTFNKRNRRFRFSQSGTAWLEVLKECLLKTGYNSWIYKEGKNRRVYVLETLAKFLDVNFDPLILETVAEKQAFIRGFFDAEGGIPRSPKSLFYIQLVQNKKDKLEKIKQILLEWEIHTGVIHIPSIKVDPDYHRMFVLSSSRAKFVELIASWHPRKLNTLLLRKDEDIVHALWRHRDNMNKASVAEAVDGSPPF